MPGTGIEPVQCRAPRNFQNKNADDILEDILLGWRLEVFTKRAKRQLAGHPKFYLSDAGVFRSLPPALRLTDKDVLVRGVWHLLRKRLL